ncbi:GTP-binding protein [Tulasnella sp. JGI-2019a]|nr:GTP-binding protein [Tulasnella sp. JGI-2019a]KAG9018439.1 GTP-binding protein [Tulasnella sp. JGI-2019a]KAG9031833.1 GTP-binding protein [Tulasnella sp. JGI-2019a]
MFSAASNIVATVVSYLIENDSTLKWRQSPRATCNFCDQYPIDTIDDYGNEAVADYHDVHARPNTRVSGRDQVQAPPEASEHEASSSATAASPLQHPVFGGAQGEDVTAFLAGVKRVAVVQGRHEDDAWLAGYTESCLRGEAMRWFDGSDQAAMMQWSKLRAGFLKRFGDCMSGSPPAVAAPPSVASRLNANVGPHPPIPDAVTASSEFAMNKALIIGDAGVGKSSLLGRYTSNSWNPHICATTGIHYEMWQASCDGISTWDHYWDASGGGQYRSLIHKYITGIRSIWLVYDITDRSSFTNIQGWFHMANHKGDGVIIRLIGNKSDRWDKRVVSMHEGRTLASSLGAWFYETSAKTNEGVQALRLGWVPSLQRGASNAV